MNDNGEITLVIGVDDVRPRRLVVTSFCWRDEEVVGNKVLTIRFNPADCADLMKDFEQVVEQHIASGKARDVVRVATETD